MSSELEIKGIDNPQDIDGVEDVDFPNYLHHFTVRAQLNKLVEADILSNDEADEAFENWKASRD